MRQSWLFLKKPSSFILSLMWKFWRQAACKTMWKMLAFIFCCSGWNTAKGTNALLPGELYDANYCPSACGSLLLAMDVKKIRTAVIIPSNLSTASGLRKGICGFKLCWHVAYRTICRVDTAPCLVNRPFKKRRALCSRKTRCVPNALI